MYNPYFIYIENSLNSLTYFSGVLNDISDCKLQMQPTC